MLVHAQSAVPPEAQAQLQHSIGSRVETLTVLGGENAVMGGIYSFDGNPSANLSLVNAGFRGDVAERTGLGATGYDWAPVLQADLGWLSSDNAFNRGFLQGNQSRIETLAVQAGGGAQVYFTDSLSLAGTLGGIYGHTRNDFDAHNANGDLVTAAGGLVNWRLDTWSVVPSAEGRYQWLWGDLTLELNSRYSFFHTESFNPSSTVVDVNGNSQTWENKLDVDVPLEWEVLGYAVHTGGYFARTELYGDVADNLNSGHVYTVNGRLALDVGGDLWAVRWVGLGASYSWADHFGGWSAGVDVRFEF